MTLPRNRLVGVYETKGADDKGHIEGYGSAFRVVDNQKDIVAPGAFKKSLDEFARVGAYPAMLWMHQLQVVGDWRKMGEDTKGLLSEGDIWHDSIIPAADMAYRVARGTAKKGLSIGYKVKGADRDTKTGIRTLTQLDMSEVSIVIYPANDEAEILSIKSLFRNEDGGIKSIRDLEEALCETLEFSRREAKALLADGARGLGLRDADVNSTPLLDEFMTGIKTLRDTVSGG